MKTIFLHQKDIQIDAETFMGKMFFKLPSFLPIKLSSFLFTKWNSRPVLQKSGFVFYGNIKF